MAEFGDPRLPSRFWDKVRVNESTGCWEWTGAKSSRGYGSFGWQGRIVKPHRLAIEALISKFPEELVVDHLCRVHCCVNPAHLEPVTQRENCRRGMSSTVMSAKYASMTVCKQGHPRTPENIYVYTGRLGHQNTQCRICKAAARLRYRQRKNSLRLKPEGN